MATSRHESWQIVCGAVGNGPLPVDDRPLVMRSTSFLHYNLMDAAAPRSRASST